MVRYIFLSLLLLTFLELAPAGDVHAEDRIFVDSAGRQVKLPTTVKRVMAAGPPASVMLYVMAPEKLVGWVREPTTPQKEYLAEPYRDLPALGQLTGKANTANIETVLAAKPDLILDVGTINDTYISLADRVQQQTGIPYALIDGGFAKTPESLRQVADLLGTKARGEELADYAEKVVAELAAMLKTVPEEKRPQVYYGRGPEGLETGLAGSINMEILEYVGATNVAAKAGKGGLANVSMEQVLSWNPDVVLTQDQKFFQSIGSNELWSKVSAVQKGKVFHVPSLPYGWFDAPPAINRLIGVPWLVAILYPEKTQVDLRQETKAFYKLFYHVDLSDEQLDKLLAGAAHK